MLICHLHCLHLTWVRLPLGNGSRSWHFHFWSGSLIVYMGNQQKMAQVLGLLPPRGPALAVAATCGVNVPMEQLSLSCPHPLPVTLPFEWINRPTYVFLKDCVWGSWLNEWKLVFPHFFSLGSGWNHPFRSRELQTPKNDLVWPCQGNPVQELKFNKSVAGSF